MPGPFSLIAHHPTARNSVVTHEAGGFFLDRAIRYCTAAEDRDARFDGAVEFQSLAGLREQLVAGLRVPGQESRGPIGRGEIVRLMLVAHGAPGLFFTEGNPPPGAQLEQMLQQALSPLSAAGRFHRDLTQIGLYLGNADGSYGAATVLFAGCASGVGRPGSWLAEVLSRIWNRGRRIVLFTTYNAAYPPMQVLTSSGAIDMCFPLGARTIPDAPDRETAIRWLREHPFVDRPHASDGWSRLVAMGVDLDERNLRAKIAVDGRIVSGPIDLPPVPSVRETRPPRQSAHHTRAGIGGRR